MSSNTYINLTFLKALLGAGVLSVSIFPGVLQPSADAVQLGDGKTFFEQSPRLVRSATSFRSPTAISNYYFTVTLPEGAGEPLKSIKISQKPNLENIALYAEETRAFLGKSPEEDNQISINAIENTRDDRPQIEIIFEEAIAPGTTVTIALKGRNPFYGGIYQFGVTAFPIGESSPGLYLGPGRLHFSQPGGGRR